MTTGYNSVLAGLIISAQYFATLFSRPHAGRYADQLGPKKVVLFGGVLRRQRPVLRAGVRR